MIPASEKLAESKLRQYARLWNKLDYGSITQDELDEYDELNQELTSIVGIALEYQSGSSKTGMEIKDEVLCIKVKAAIRRHNLPPECFGAMKEYAIDLLDQTDHLMAFVTKHAQYAWSEKQEIQRLKKEIEKHERASSQQLITVTTSD